MDEPGKAQQQNQNYKNERTTKRSFVFWSLAGLILIGYDQLTKYLAFVAGDDRSFGFEMSIHPFFNNNFAFSLPLSGWFMMIIYAVVLGGFAYYVFVRAKNFNYWQNLAAMLILAGGLSNVIERLVLGGVRDFIAIRLYAWTGFYNLADFYILAGIILLLVAPAAHRQKNYDI